MSWYLKKCCEKQEDTIYSCFDDFWIDDGRAIVTMFEGDAELETRFELKECPACGEKIVCYERD